MSKEHIKSDGRIKAIELPSPGHACLVGGGEMGRLMRAYDWSQTAFGSVEQWPQSLRSALSICLNSRFPIAIYWGADCLLLYNDAWRPIVGDKHPWSLGRPGREVWSEIWDVVGPELASVLATGEGILHCDELLSMHRFGYTEECYFDYTFNPIQGEAGAVDGILNIVSETTYRVLNDRRAQLLREVASRTGTAKTAEEACALMIKTLRSDPADIPFALLYLFDQDGRSLRLCGSTQVEVDSFIAPAVLDLELNESDRWLITHVAHTGQSAVITDLVTRFAAIPGSPWAEPPKEAMVLPIAGTGQGKVLGVLVAVASPRRRLDENYHDFLGQIAGQIATAIANAHSYEEERRRAEQLAELDRAKTAFFSNVSHEFRTPLTLMLGPVEDALRETQDAEQRDRLELIHRNALRLQKLVNTLLDFSRIEAGRIQAAYTPTDLATLTADLAGVFRSAIERAGLDFQVDCPPLPESVYVDREMWEKIVLNLLSNAFKFTFEGKITVTLHACNDHVELNVQDTGTGIPAAELPHIFERFRRVKGARGRSYEGSGIGLSLVQELVKLHGGTVTVSSIEGQGTCFTVCLPLGMAHLPPERIAAIRSQASTATGAIAYVEEAQRWLPGAEVPNLVPTVADVEFTSDGFTSDGFTSDGFTSWAERSNPELHQTRRIVLADDNADMREYIKRLLSQTYEVEAVANGRDAITAIQRQQPDLVLTDVMMPEMDGFELLRSLRSQPQTQTIPVILLSARAGEEARVEGLESGADDYLTKPFSARELIAKVEATLKLSQVRQEAMQQEQVLRQEAEASQQQVETILASINDGFYVLDRNWCFTYVNDRYCEMVAMPRAAILGQNIWQLFPATVNTAVYVQFQQAMHEQTPLQFDDFDALWNCWYNHRIYPSTSGMSVLLSDISDRKRAELKTEFFAILNQTLIEANSVDELIETVGEHLHRYLNISGCALVEINEAAGEATVYHEWHQDNIPSLIGRIYQIREFITDELQQTIKLGEPIAFRDVTTDPHILSPEQYHALGIAAELKMPLIKDGEWKFSLSVFHAQPYNWRTDELELMRELSERIWHQIERIRAEAALRASEERYRTLFNSMDEGYILADILFDENDRPIDIFYLDANPAASRLTGLDLIGRRLREIAPNYESYWWEIFGRVAQTGLGERHELYATPLKSWYNFYVFKMGDANSRRVAAVFQNVTDRKTVEQERERFLAVGSDLQVITGNNGYFQWVSPTFERTLGWTQAEMTSHPWIDFVHPEDINPSLAETDSLFSGKETLRFENRYRHKDGSYRWFLWQAKPYPTEQVIYGAAVDITERKQTETALRQSEQRLQAIIDNSKAAIFLKDVQGNYLLMNRECERLFGITNDWIRGKTDYDIFPQETADALLLNDRQVIESGTALTLEEVVPLDDGIHTYIAVKFPLLDSTGVPYAICGISTDISDRARLQAERDRFLEREQAARLEAERANRVKDEFLAVLSHELRSPLNPILGWSKLLQSGKLDTARQAEALATIERNAKLQLQLIEDLLDISRIMQGKLTLTVAPVNLSSVISAAIETVRLAAEAKTIELRVDLAPTATISGDAARLQQVVWNLLTNAVKFTPNGGKVGVELRQIAQIAQIRVIDTGKGIQPHFLPYVFEYFQQEDGSTTRKFGGLGLGLAIVRQIVEMHGGTVSAESGGENQGATFIVQLPVAQRAMPTISEPSHAKLQATQAPLANLQILVVDDDQDTLEFQAFLLEQSGAKVIAVTSGLEALHVLDQVIPDVLVSDVGMAEMDGYMLIQQIRSRLPSQGGTIPAIALTAYARDFDQQKALEAGFQAHITKPVEPERLVKAIVDLVTNNSVG